MDLLTIKILLLSIPTFLLVVGIVWFILIKKILYEGASKKLKLLFLYNEVEFYF